MSGELSTPKGLEAGTDIETQRQTPGSNTLSEKTVIQNEETRHFPRSHETESNIGLERWNSSRLTIFRFLACNLGMFIMGMNDACIGALIPYIEPYYKINYTIVSTLFAVPFLGYLIAGLTNNYIHLTLGQRGVAILGPLSRLIGYIPVALHPPFPVLPVVLVFAGFGNGIEDSAWNAWVGNMHNANELLGFLHGSYGLGATVSPLVASAMVAEGGLEWYTFYYIMIGVATVEFAVTVSAFWTATGAAHRANLTYYDEGKPVTISTVLKEPVTWLVAIFLLGYVGAEVSLGGWIVTFMLQVRHAEPFLAGLTVTLFWLGLTIGRVTLGFVTGRIGEKLAILIYLALCIGLEILYWLIPSFAASIVFVILLGYFLGPLFPAAVVVASKVLPREYHVSAIGFAAAFGGGGAAVVPFVVGAIAQHKGVEVLQPIVIALFVVIILIWLVIPGGFKKGGLERAGKGRERPGEDFKKAAGWVKRRVTST